VACVLEDAAASATIIDSRMGVLIRMILINSFQDMLRLK